MFTYLHPIRVRYKDVDRMGYVYYGNYAYYYEQARAESIRHLGITYRELEDSGIIMPITRMSIKYSKPAYYDELLQVKVIVPEKPGRLIRFLYEVFNEKGELINEGETILTFVTVANNRVTTTPSPLMEKLLPFFNKSL